MKKLLAVLKKSRFFIFLACGSIVILAILFSINPAIVNFERDISDDYYRQKIQSPFIDLSTTEIDSDEGTRSHGLKLTPRIFPALLIHFATNHGQHVFLVSSVCWLLLLSTTYTFSKTHFESDACAFFLTLCIALMPVSNVCVGFTSHPWKPFDGTPLALLSCIICFQKKYLLQTLLYFLAYWSDERVLVATPVLLAVNFYLGKKSLGHFLLSCLGPLIGFAAYLVLRVSISAALQWNTPDMSMVNFSTISLTTQSWQLALWLPFQGAWLIILFAFKRFFNKKNYFDLILMSAISLVAISSIFIVFDTTRASAFIYPLIILYAIAIKDSYSKHARVRIFALSSFVSLLSPNFFLIAMGTPNICYDTPLGYYLLKSIAKAII